MHDFSRPGSVLQVGVAPVRVDVLTALDGLDFGAAWELRETGEMDGLRLNFLSRDDFVRNKRAVGRAQDLADIERLLDK